MIVSGYEKFTDRARKALELARNESERLNHSYIGSEHLLLGLVAERGGIACTVLNGLNVELAKVRTATEFIIGRGDRSVGDIGLTPRARRVIELAIDEARRLGHNYIGTEHLLLGLIREGEGIAAGILESLGVNLDVARNEVIKVISQRPKTISPSAIDNLAAQMHRLRIGCLIAEELQENNPLESDFRKHVADAKSLADVIKQVLKDQQ